MAENIEEIFLKIYQYFYIRYGVKTMLKNGKYDYNYKQVSVIFDLDDAKEKELMEWLEKNKTKKEGYSILLKKALKDMIEKESKK